MKRESKRFFDCRGCRAGCFCANAEINGRRAGAVGAGRAVVVGAGIVGRAAQHVGKSGTRFLAGDSGKYRLPGRSHNGYRCTGKNNMDMKWFVVAGVAALVLLIARKANAGVNPADPRNWDYVPDYVPGSGRVT